MGKISENEEAVVKLAEAGRSTILANELPHPESAKRTPGLTKMSNGAFLIMHKRVDDYKHK